MADHHRYLAKALDDPETERICKEILQKKKKKLLADSFHDEILSELCRALIAWLDVEDAKSEEEKAARIGRDRSTLHRYREGKRKMTTDTLLRAFFVIPIDFSQIKLTATQFVMNVCSRVLTQVGRDYFQHEENDELTPGQLACVHFYLTDKRSAVLNPDYQDKALAAAIHEALEEYPGEKIDKNTIREAICLWERPYVVLRRVLEDMNWRLL